MLPDTFRTILPFPLKGHIRPSSPSCAKMSNSLTDDEFAARLRGMTGINDIWVDDNNHSYEGGGDSQEACDRGANHKQEGYRKDDEYQVCEDDRYYSDFDPNEDGDHGASYRYAIDFKNSSRHDP